MMESILRISSSLKSMLSSVMRLLSNCATDDVPMMQLVTRLSANTHAKAIWAIDCPRSRAIAANCFTAFTRSCVTWLSFRKPVLRAARLPSGMPLSYLPVSRPCAKGEKHITPLPLSAAIWKLAFLALGSNIEQRYCERRHGT